MEPNLLVLGGTTEATALCRSLAPLGVQATVSLAGRVAQPKPLDLPARIGGFGGVDGLMEYLRDHKISHVVDATHPFAAQMSRNAIDACGALALPLVALTRGPWSAQPGDRWTHVPDVPAAVNRLHGAALRIFLAVGRTPMAAFGVHPQHHYVVRLVDHPGQSLPFPNSTVIVERGPFDDVSDRMLLQANGIDLVVSKNSGGTGAVAKITAARQLGLPVLMIDRPQIPKRAEVHDPKSVIAWLARHGADLGV